MVITERINKKGQVNYFKNTLNLKTFETKLERISWMEMDQMKKDRKPFAIMREF